MERIRVGSRFGAGLLAVVAAFLALAGATLPGRPVKARAERPRATAENADPEKHDGSPLKTEGRETQVLRKTDGRWELVHVHYSGMPATGKREGS
jgi:hypothetical protein